MTLGWPTLVLVGVLLLAAFFFAGSETALFSLQKVDRQRFANGDATSRRVLRMLDKRAAVITTVLIGNESANIGIASIGAAWFAVVVPRYPWLNALLLPPLMVLLAEITPKILAFRFNAIWARAAVWPLTLFYWAFTPFRLVVSAVVGLIARTLFRVNPDKRPEGLREAEILSLLDQGAESGDVDERERDIVEAVFEFGGLTVGRLMTPRPDIFAVPLDLPWNDLLSRCREAGFSRVPVFQRRSDDIIGVLLLKDLLRHRNAGNRPQADTQRLLRSLLLPPVFVPQSKPANAMLREFLGQKYHMAFVVDEHGTLVGLVTLDDLLTELVGEFLEKDEAEESSIQSMRPGQYHVKAWTDVEDFAEETGIELPRDGYHTVGGFVFHQLGRVPNPGDAVDWGPLRFVVGSMEGRRISEVIVEMPLVETPRPAATADDAESAEGAEKEGAQS